MLKNAYPRYYTLWFIIACGPPKNGCCQFTLHSACRFDPTNPSNGKAHRRASPATHYTLSRSENVKNADHLRQIQLFSACLSFLCNLLTVESHIFSAYYMSAILFIATLSSLSVAIPSFLYEISQSTEEL